MKKVYFNPPFHMIKVVNLVTASLVLEDFANTFTEGHSLREFYKHCWPAPAYKVTFIAWPTLSIEEKRNFKWEGK